MDQPDARTREEQAQIERSLQFARAMAAAMSYLYTDEEVIHAPS